MEAMEGFIGEIRCLANTGNVDNYLGNSWLPCNGQLLPWTNANTGPYLALQIIIQNTYGGQPGTTFQLPNLNGNTGFPALAVLGAGQGPTLTEYTLGQIAGAQQVTLNASNSPSHTHDFEIVVTNKTHMTPAPMANVTSLSRAILQSGSPVNMYKADPGNLVQMPPNTLSPALAQSPLPHNNMMPYLTRTYYICYSGYFPIPNAAEHKATPD